MLEAVLRLLARLPLNWLHRFGAVTASVCNLRPSSRGAVSLSGPGLEHSPRIDPNYLATEEDRRVAVESLKWARRIRSRFDAGGFGPSPCTRRFACTKLSMACAGWGEVVPGSSVGTGRTMGWNAQCGRFVALAVDQIGRAHV